MLLEFQRVIHRLPKLALETAEVLFPRYARCKLSAISAGGLQPLSANLKECWLCFLSRRYHGEVSVSAAAYCSR